MQMFEFELVTSADTFSKISEPCTVPISESVSIPALKLNKDEFPISTMTTGKRNIFVINFNYDEVRKYRLVDETWGAISQLVRSFIGKVLNVY